MDYFSTVLDSAEELLIEYETCGRIRCFFKSSSLAEKFKHVNKKLKNAQEQLVLALNAEEARPANDGNAVVPWQGGKGSPTDAICRPE